MFDFPPAKVESYLHEWALLKDWIGQALVAQAPAPDAVRPEVERLRTPMRSVLSSGQPLAAAQAGLRPAAAPLASPVHVPAFLSA